MAEHTITKTKHETRQRSRSNTARRTTERRSTERHDAERRGGNSSLAALRALFGLVLTTAVVIGVVLAVRGTGSAEEEPLPSPVFAAAEAPQEPAVQAPAATPEPVPASLQLPEVDLDSWELRLVSVDHQLPADYAPELMSVDNDQLFDVRAGMHLQKMLADARAAGYTTFICSGYRSYDTQYYLYWQHVEQFMAEGMPQEEAEAATRLAVNYPGASEHQLGLAADILEYQGQDMEPYIGGSGLMLWLEEHCADYGFIVRYPEDKTDVTGIEYEPWHLRFVGSCARFLMENNLCLEEFLALYR